MKLSIVLLTLLLTACAGMNPNPGERTTDTNWEQGNYSRAIEVARPLAEQGYPWAQLRLGIYYNSGYGIEVDIPEAIKWYKLAARQLEESKWAEGYLVDATGEYGYFGQKNDALIAQYRLADLYYNGEGSDKNLVLALLIINNVIAKSNGEPQVFFCCDWSGGRWFRQTQFTDLKSKIEEELTDTQKAEFSKLSATWVLKNDL
ncbi:tetratricopeptide repeat protein [Microbulbifer sp. PAAF003]|uniref:tetratricopeptide repeat protein n=1 Tax=Microbulbifer sp. PAAF003 TaxID=3243375 RepID=UPI0040394742